MELHDQAQEKTELKNEHLFFDSPLVLMCNRFNLIFLINEDQSRLMLRHFAGVNFGETYDDDDITFEDLASRCSIEADLARFTLNHISTKAFAVIAIVDFDFLEFAQFGGFT